MSSTHQHQYESLGNIDNIHQFEALFDFATIGIIVTNDHGEIINYNKCAEAQFGFTRDEVMGKKVEILLPPRVHERHVTYREYYYQNPEPRIMGHGRDLFAQNKSGSTFPVEVSLSHYVINQKTFVIAFVIDITVRKQHEGVVLAQKNELERVTTEIKKMNSELEQKVEDRTKMLREALAELERSKEELNEAFEYEKELSELKSRFVTMASHEFRTPLSTILSSAYLLEKYEEQLPNDKVKKHLHRIKGAVAGMKSILEDFLSLGKLEEGLVQTTPEKISPQTLCAGIENLLQEMEAMLKSGQQVVFTHHVATDIYIDNNLLKNILMNLLSNAIKFAPEHSSITVHALLENNILSIAVADKGIGISEEDQQHLFERFFRARNASNIQGTGLGLHIVAKYLELMHGTIHMHSIIDEGTTVTIHLPQTKLNKQP